MNEQELAEKFEGKNITLAPFAKRIFAFVVDEIIVAIFLLIAFSENLSALNNQNEVEALTIYLAPYLMVMKIVYQTFFIWMYGATPGKMLMKVKVIYVQTLENPSLLYSFIRACGRIVSESIAYIGFLWALFNPKRETWQDLVAKTLVVNA